MADTTGAPEPPRRKSGALKVFIWLSVAAVVALTAWTSVLNFVAEPYRVPGESMAPAVKPGERVIVNKLAYRSAPPKPGDVIVFKAPPEWSTGYTSIRSRNAVVRWIQNALSVVHLVPPDENNLIKRVIAVGGQTVECRVATGLTVNGQPLPEPYLDPATMQADPKIYPCLGNEFGPVAVPEGRLWVMGDKRTQSRDSRAHCTNVPSDAQRGLACTGDPTAGTIPVANVIGKATPAPGWLNR